MSSTHPAYRPDIDGLRAVAVLAVILFHAFPQIIRGGFIGVDVFFVISGFLISTILMKELAAGSFSYTGFYIRRIRRLFPALIVVLLTCWTLGWFSLFADEFRQLGKHIAGGALFSANFVFWSEAGYFDQASGQKLLLHLWSLGIEEQFYIFWPVLLGLFWKPRAAAIGITALLVLSFLVSIGSLALSKTAAFYFPLARFWELMAGALLAWACLHQPTALSSHANAQALLGLAMLIVGFVCIQESSAFPGYWVLLPVVGTVLLLSAGMQAWINRWLLGNQLMVGIGLISYPLYLWHWPVMAFIRIFKHGELSQAYALRAIAVSFLLAWLTWRFVETPLRRKSAPVRTTVLLSLCMAVLAVAGMAAFLSGGFGERKAATIVSKELLDEVRMQEFASDGSCLAKLGLNEKQNRALLCVAVTGHPEYAVLGDSHGLSLLRAAAIGKADFNAVYMGQNGCLPFPSYTSRLVGENKDGGKCRRSTETALTYVQGNDDIKTVLLITRGTSYISNSGFGVEVIGDWGIYDADDRKMDSRAAFVDGYAQTIKQLLDAGKTVVFVIDWPELGVDPRGCVGNRLLTVNKRIEKIDCINKRAVVTARQAEYRALVDEIRARHPGLQIYDPTHLFCDNDACYGRRGDQVYYSDDDHLSVSGSRMVIEDLMRWLAPLPATPRQ